MPQFYLSMWYLNLIVPFKIRFGFVSGKFDRAIVRSLARIKIPTARPERDSYATEGSKFGQVTISLQPYQVSDLISQNIRTVDMAWLANWQYGQGTKVNGFPCCKQRQALEKITLQDKSSGYLRYRYVTINLENLYCLINCLKFCFY